MKRNRARPKVSRRRKPDNTKAVDSRNAILDQLAEFKEFMALVPKSLRRAIIDGKSAKEIYEEFSTHAACRAVMIMMTEKDSGKALAAIKDIQDRVHGKATEHKEVKHRLDDMPPEELDAIVVSELEDIGLLEGAGEDN
jgi:hypothetical protein